MFEGGRGGCRVVARGVGGERTGRSEWRWGEEGSAEAVRREGRRAERDNSRGVTVWERQGEGCRGPREVQTSMVNTVGRLRLRRREG